jgi:hypothetical protein
MSRVREWLSLFHCLLGEAMRFHKLSKGEWVVVGIIFVVVAALMLPTPFWTETVSESCHLCGNRRVTIRHYRWWRLDTETIEPAAVFPVPQGHVHDWWQYSSTYSAPFGPAWAKDKDSRYRDGEMTWNP